MSSMKVSYVYIETNYEKSVFYTGVTSDIHKRHYQHQDGTYNGFSSKYHTKYLVWYDVFSPISEAIKFEKRLKRWRRSWKIELIEKTNPEWLDLSTNEPFGRRE